MSLVKASPVPVEKKAGWILKAVCTFARKVKFIPLSVIEPRFLWYPAWILATLPTWIYLLRSSDYPSSLRLANSEIWFYIGSRDWCITKPTGGLTASIMLSALFRRSQGTLWPGAPNEISTRWTGNSCNTLICKFGHSPFLSEYTIWVQTARVTNPRAAPLLYYSPVLTNHFPPLHLTLLI